MQFLLKPGKPFTYYMALLYHFINGTKEPTAQRNRFQVQVCHHGNFSLQLRQWDQSRPRQYVRHPIHSRNPTYHHVHRSHSCTCPKFPALWHREHLQSPVLGDEKEESVGMGCECEGVGVWVWRSGGVSVGEWSGCVGIGSVKVERVGSSCVLFCSSWILDLWTERSSNRYKRVHWNEARLERGGKMGKKVEVQGWAHFKQATPSCHSHLQILC